MKTISKKFKFNGNVWLYTGKAAWHFLILSKKTSSEIKSFIKDDSSAWGSVKVVIEVDQVKWVTSIFPDSKLGSFLLPIKKEIRKTLGITESSKIRGTLTASHNTGFMDR